MSLSFTPPHSRILTGVLAGMLIAYCSVSCDKHLPVIEDGAVESVSISLRNVGSVSTKSVAHTAEESAVSTLDVFVFRDGALEAHGRVSGASSVSGLKVSHGAKTVWAFANFSTERMNAIRSLSDAVSLASQYSENSRTSFVMRGSKNITVSSSETSFTMSVTRDVSKVIIDAAPVFTGTAAGGTLEGIYLINIPKVFDEDAVLTSSDGANAWNFDNTVASSPDGSACSYATGSSSWSSALYGMPNASPEAADADTKDYVTKCVLKATVQGQTYWYPVGIPDMQANKCYAISNIVINRPGSENPNSYLTEESLSVSITVSPWDEGEMTGHYNDGIYAAPRGYHMGHEWVDLGLRETIDGVVYKVLFATSNIGASSETDYGDYFAWGETSKRYTSISGSTIVGGTFGWASTPFETAGNGSKFSKYTASNDSFATSGTADGKSTLESSDDVASVLWGGCWRMPDESDLEYLISSSVTYSWTSDYNSTGVSGFVVTGKGSFSGVSLFLPAAGDCAGGSLFNAGGFGNYWSRSLDSDYQGGALYLRVEDGDQSMDIDDRFNGQSVRPVYVVPDHTNPMNIAANGHDYVDLGLRKNGKKILFATCNIGASSPYEDGDYFAWAETEKRYSGFYPDGTIVNFDNTHSFKITNAPYHTGSSVTTGWSKYIPTGKESYTVNGTADNLLILEASDDVASVMWGGNWRMPDSSELEFLISSSVDYVFDTCEGVPGLRVTGKGDFASSSVFLSAAGACEGNELNNKNYYGKYWSKVLYSNTPSEAYHLFFSAHEFVLEDFVRYYGCSVRPVLEVDE